VLRIGYLGSLDSNTAQGAQLAIDQINSAGGVTAPDGVTYTFELVGLTAGLPTADAFANSVNEITLQNVVAILGPDNNDLLSPQNIQALQDTRLPILSGATVDTLTEADTDNTIFRVRAPERVYSHALADYMATDLGFTQIALVQTDIESTEALVDFETALSALGLTSAARIQAPGETALTTQAQQLVELNPEAVVLWGPAETATTLLRLLRDGGWTGRFAYRYAQQAAEDGILPDDLANGVLGMNNWSFAYTDRSSRIFTRDYLTSFSAIPGPMAAASYDAIWFLRAVIIDSGATADLIIQGLLNASPRTFVQGTLHPIEFGNGDLVRTGMVYELGARGGPVVLARYDDETRLELEDAGPVAQAVPSPTSSVPTETPFPTATLEGNWVLVTANTLNVRSGPGFNYDKIGEAALNDTLRILGTISDGTWLVVDFEGGFGWVKTEFTQLISGSLATVAIVQAPASPTPGATFTPTLPPNPDIVIDSVVFNQTQLVPNRPFTAVVTVRNAGGSAAGQFAVAGTFEPGGVYTASFVGGLAGGQTAQTQLTATVTGTGSYSVAVIADLNNDIPEGNETNNTYNLSYRVDYPNFTQQTGIQLSVGGPWDLYGGTPDILWDGSSLMAQGAAKLGILAGQTFENAHYDLASPSAVTSTTITSDQINPGVVFGVLTAEGERGIIRIDNRSGNQVWISYRVYNDTP
jgi:ABC-type branched-subunit amino acid transport system substrate-binding protein